MESVSLSEVVPSPRPAVNFIACQPHPFTRTKEDGRRVMADSTVFCPKCGTLLKAGGGCPRCDIVRVPTWEIPEQEEGGEGFEGL